MRFRYGSFGSDDVFRMRIKCHLMNKHDWKFCDAYGNLQRCTKCGLYRSYRKCSKGGWLRDVLKKGGE